MIMSDRLAITVVGFSCIHITHTVGKKWKKIKQNKIHAECESELYKPTKCFNMCLCECFYVFYPFMILSKMWYNYSNNIIGILLFQIFTFLSDTYKT